MESACPTATKIRFVALDSNIVCTRQQSANNRHRRRFKRAKRNRHHL